MTIGTVAFANFIVWLLWRNDDMTGSHHFVVTLNSLSEMERTVVRLHTSHYPEHSEYVDLTHRDLVESLSALRESIDRCRGARFCCLDGGVASRGEAEAASLLTLWMNLWISCVKAVDGVWRIVEMAILPAIRPAAYQKLHIK